MRIGEAARLAGLEASAIRFYESNGVIPRPTRTESGYRDYACHEVDLLRFVQRLRSLGLPLDDIREIVGLRTEGKAPCATVRASMARETAAIDRRIDDLRRLRAELEHLQEAAADIIDAWPDACVCHVIDSPRRGADRVAVQR